MKNKTLQVIDRQCAYTGRYLGTNFVWDNVPQKKPAISHSITYLATRIAHTKEGECYGFDSPEFKIDRSDLENEVLK